MIRLALDTSAYSAFKRGHSSIAARLRRAEELLLSTIVLGKLLGGFEAGRQLRRNREELDRFLTSRRVRVVSIGQITARRYAAIYAVLRAKGQPIPTNDLWIAASAIEHGAELITTDRDFTHVPQIAVALYEP